MKIRKQRKNKKEEIKTDVFGSYTGVDTTNVYDKPEQDADDL